MPLAATRFSPVLLRRLVFAGLLLETVLIAVERLTEGGSGDEAVGSERSDWRGGPII
jgi:hypothetical protein